MLVYTFFPSCCRFSTHAEKQEKNFALPLASYLSGARHYAFSRNHCSPRLANACKSLALDGRYDLGVTGVIPLRPPICYLDAGAFNGAVALALGHFVCEILQAGRNDHPRKDVLSIEQVTMTKITS